MASSNWYLPYKNDRLLLRDVLAIERTRLAYERTLLAYLRSGLYFVFAGLSILSFKELVSIHYLGIGLVPLGLATAALGVWRHVNRIKQLRILKPDESRTHHSLELLDDEL
ncbi:MAG: DUF202 domain-containing protein [Bacteroidia bacterium]|nr:DUF202 domain-containing protein [Bacteroidia bacterium]